MPSSIIHRCVSKRVLEKGNLFKDKNDIFEYEIGSIAPDSWRNSIRFKESDLPKKEKRKYSHFSNDGEFIEQYMDFYSKYKDMLNKPFMMGYFVHLLTDHRWRNTMFYRCFDKDGAVVLLDGSTLNGEKGVRKELLHKESKKMAYLLSRHFKLNDLRNLTNNEVNFLPEMSEIEFDGLNDTINYTNMESNNDPGNELLVYKLEDFVSGIEECSDYILNQLKEFDLYK